MDAVDTLVIGAGVVGLAVARKLAQTGREVLILERAGAIGTETSARNSEVIHAGIYYPKGSLRAALCLKGRDQLYAYLGERGLPHKRIGKLIVATTEAQKDKLTQIRTTAAEVGAGDLPWLTRAEALALEPELDCTAALWSPQTGILDSHALMVSLLGDAEAAGAALALNTEVTRIETGEDGHVLTIAGEAAYRLKARRVVNAAGLQALPLAAATSELRDVPKPRYAHGTYFGVSGKVPFRHLIYPVPEPGGLGIHLTLDMGGGMRFGPDVEWIDGVDYRLDPARAAAFGAAIRLYWPGVPAETLAPVSCGVRPKLHGPDEPAADFRVDGPSAHGIPGLVNLFGIESPGLTASLALADLVAGELGLAPG